MAGKAAGHQWVGAAVVPLPSNIVRQADQRGTVRLNEKTKIVVLEVYCARCRRPHQSVADDPCEALDSKDHLIGGPIGTRKRRVVEDCEPQQQAL